MKNFLLTLFLVLCQINLYSQTNHITEKGIARFVVSDLFKSTFKLGYEYPISDKLSIVLDGGLNNSKVNIWESLEARFSGYSFALHIRYYYSNKATAYGGYVSTYIKYGKFKMNLLANEDKAELLDGHRYKFGLLTGWQFRIFKNSGFASLVDFHIGGGLSKNKYYSRFSKNGKRLFFSKSFFLPDIGISIGIPINNLF